MEKIKNQLQNIDSLLAQIYTNGDSSLYLVKSRELILSIINYLDIQLQQQQNEDKKE